MTKNVILFLLLFVPFIVNGQNYFQKYQELADSLENEYCIPSSIILAVAYLESGGGKSIVAKHSNNHFGIVGRNHKVKNTRYRYYESVTDSYIGFCKLITSKTFYHKVKNEDNVHKWLKHISNSGYASGSTTWVRKILIIIDNNNLT
jgi:Bax protein